MATKCCFISGEERVYVNMDQVTPASRDIASKEPFPTVVHSSVYPSSALFLFFFFFSFLFFSFFSLFFFLFFFNLISFSVSFVVVSFIGGGGYGSDCQYCPPPSPPLP